MFLDCRDDCRHGAAVKIELHRVTFKALRDKCLEDTTCLEELYCGMFQGIPIVGKGGTGEKEYLYSSKVRGWCLPAGKKYTSPLCSMGSNAKRVFQLCNFL